MKVTKAMVVLGAVFICAIVTLLLLANYFSKPLSVTSPKISNLSPALTIPPLPTNTPEPSAQRKIYLIEIIKETKNGVNSLQNEDKTMIAPSFVFDN